MDPLLATAIAAAEAAAAVHLRHFGKVGVGEAREKAASDFVSEVDLEAQRAAVDRIRARFPDHAILAEEEDGEEARERRWPEEGRRLWIIDPLDGTTNYLHRHPMFGASVAVGRGVASAGADAPRVRPVEEAGRVAVPAAGGDAWIGGGAVEAGAVVAPSTGERWWALRGGGAWKNGRPVRVSGLTALRPALVGTGFPFKEPSLVPGYLEELGRVLGSSGGVRRGGSAALDLCYLAEGILDAFWEEAYLAPWDVAAGLLILREAGGIAVRIDGSGLDLENGSLLAANSPALLEALGQAVRGAG